jgi:hypothetical protein
MARPVTNPTKVLSIRTTAAERAALRRLALDLGVSEHAAALEAVRTGLLMSSVIGLPVGQHVIVPGSENCVLALSAGPKDSAKVQAVIDLWSAT